ncbi:NRAMP family divalent metal transporter [Lysobacter niastensis]|uniref:Divalent metal cation transporter n=1 Tax=Lysobacter niastensis TaxID=380629 RepID=A0ABS0BAW1_9GAMM|nr:divalent metal cation transporter [Lysobacter niastensis]MBF6024846.1 divalent metal cation transporter [Lysobacter niastensis]
MSAHKRKRGLVRRLHERTGAPAHAVAHHRRGVALRFARLRASGLGALAAFLAVLGPGLLAGLSDDDPAGITTYSILGTDHGYRLLWIIPASTVLLVQFHLMAMRIGAATSKGFVGVIRERWGHRWGYAAVVGLVFANFGTICAEYAGISAACSLVGIPPWISAPISATLISLVVVLGSFHRVERVLLIVSATLGLYLLDGILATPDWSLVWHNSIVPHAPHDAAGWIAVAATLGTTLAPWGLAFIQSYAVDKKITLANLRWERIDVVIGSLLTGLIGLAIAVACAATLYRAGAHIDEASDAAAALRPLAGPFATALFGTGLLGAALLAAAIVPLATAYSIAEGVGSPASLDLDSHHFRIFYVAFVILTVAAASVVSLPGLPLIPIIYSSQVVNAVMLPLHVIALQLLARDPKVMGDSRSGRVSTITGWMSILLILSCISALVWSWIGASASS